MSTLYNTSCFGSLFSYFSTCVLLGCRSVIHLYLFISFSPRIYPILYCVSFCCEYIRLFDIDFLIYFLLSKEIEARRLRSRGEARSDALYSFYIKICDISSPCLYTCVYTYIVWCIYMRDMSICKLYIYMHVLYIYIYIPLCVVIKYSEHSIDTRDI